MWVPQIAALKDRYRVIALQKLLRSGIAGERRIHHGIHRQIGYPGRFTSLHLRWKQRHQG